MSYKNIVWVKLQLELLSDMRFIERLTVDERYLYIGLILLAGATKNNTPHDIDYIKRMLNLPWKREEIEVKLTKIKKTFPKLVSLNGYLKLRKFNELHNYIGKSQGNPSGLQDKDKEEDKIKTQEALSYYYLTYEKMKNAKCVPNYGKDGAIAKRILGTLSLDEFKAKVDVFFTLKDEFLDRAGYTMGVFSSYVNKITPKPKGRGDV